jgi:hypothetical protein
MSRSLVNTLASVVAAAQKSLPRDTGATYRAEQRLNRPRRHVILADVSASMAEPAAGRRKIDVLNETLAALDTSDSGILAFSSHVTPIGRGASLPPAGGGTALHLALGYCARIDASDILVISDGHPDRPGDALVAADRLQARIDVIYCGPDNDAEGMAFMRRLARSGGAAHRGNLSAPQELIATARRLMIEGPR